MYTLYPKERHRKNDSTECNHSNHITKSWKILYYSLRCTYSEEIKQDIIYLLIIKFIFWGFMRYALNFMVKKSEFLAICSEYFYLN